MYIYFYAANKRLTKSVDLLSRASKNRTIPVEKYPCESVPAYANRATLNTNYPGSIQR